jgi:DNA-binding LytR/AlgR family response regulator
MSSDGDANPAVFVTNHKGGYLRLLVVDDEPPAVDELRWLLTQQPAVAEVCIASSVSGTLRVLDDRVIDAVFMDIEMPDLSGIELARVLRRFANPPLVVFVTAFERHAIDAFEVKAIDYVLKPIRHDRLDRTLARLCELLPNPADAATKNGSTDQPRTRLAIESPGRTSFVERDCVIAVEASRDYVRLHTLDKSHLVRIPISVLETEWSEVGFVRVHRSFLVAVKHVVELRSEGNGLSVVVGSKEIPVSRTYSRTLRERLVDRNVKQ